MSVDSNALGMIKFTPEINIPPTYLKDILPRESFSALINGSVSGVALTAFLSLSNVYLKTELSHADSIIEGAFLGAVSGGAVSFLFQSSSSQNKSEQVGCAAIGAVAGAITGGTLSLMGNMINKRIPSRETYLIPETKLQNRIHDTFGELSQNGNQFNGFTDTIPAERRSQNDSDPSASTLNEPIKKE